MMFCEVELVSFVGYSELAGYIQLVQEIEMVKLDATVKRTWGHQEMTLALREERVGWKISPLWTHVLLVGFIICRQRWEGVEPKSMYFVIVIYQWPLGRHAESALEYVATSSLINFRQSLMSSSESQLALKEPADAFWINWYNIHWTFSVPSHQHGFWSCTSLVNLSLGGKINCGVGLEGREHCK